MFGCYFNPFDEAVDGSVELCLRHAEIMTVTAAMVRRIVHAELAASRTRAQRFTTVRAGDNLLVRKIRIVRPFNELERRRQLAANRILEQPKSTIDFDDIINSGKILICNFSKGLIGEDTSELFGITVLAKLQLASLRRARLKQSERRAYHLYVDEFQNFATASFVQMLSESRKYKLFMTMAEQSTSQQKDQKMVDIILANVGTVICFRTGNPQDERLLLPLFSPYIAEGEISNQPPFNFYARLSAAQSQEPLSGQTLLLEDGGNNDIAIVVIENSRLMYAKKVEPVQPEEQEEKKPKPETRAKPEPQKKSKPKDSPKQDASGGRLDGQAPQPNGS